MVATRRSPTRSRSWRRHAGWLAASTAFHAAVISWLALSAIGNVAPVWTTYIPPEPVEPVDPIYIDLTPRQRLDSTVEPQPQSLIQPLDATPSPLSPIQTPNVVDQPSPPAPTSAPAPAQARTTTQIQIETMPNAPSSMPAPTPLQGLRPLQPNARIRPEEQGVAPVYRNPSSPAAGQAGGPSGPTAPPSGPRGVDPQWRVGPGSGTGWTNAPAGDCLSQYNWLTPEQRAACDRRMARTPDRGRVTGTGDAERDRTMSAQAAARSAAAAAQRAPLAGGVGVAGPEDCVGSNFGTGCAGSHLPSVPSTDMRQGGDSLVRQPSNRPD